eukprot:s914_g18.t1
MSQAGLADFLTTTLTQTHGFTSCSSDSFFHHKRCFGPRNAAGALIFRGDPQVLRLRRLWDRGTTSLELQRFPTPWVHPGRLSLVHLGGTTPSIRS